MIHKRKNNELVFIKIKHFFSSKEPVKLMKRQVTDQEKIFANHMSDKGFASSIYTTSEKSIIRKQTIQFLKKP